MKINYLECFKPPAKFSGSRVASFHYKESNNVSFATGFIMDTILLFCYGVGLKQKQIFDNYINNITNKTNT